MIFVSLDLIHLLNNIVARLQQRRPAEQLNDEENNSTISYRPIRTDFQ
jgi:hypothetical protein